MRIQLTAPHTHAGRQYPTGAMIELPDTKAQWLIGLGRATPITDDDKPAPRAAKPKE